MIGRARIPIGLGLIVGVLGSIAATAALIHLPWWFTARADVTELALKVNRASIADVEARMSTLLAERARAFRAAPPSEDWDGVVAISEK